MHGYVHCPAHVGRDRRVHPHGMRLLERRRIDAADLSPPVAIALRQLNMYVIAITDAGSLAAFRERLGATAALANARGERAVGQSLHALQRALGQRQGRNIQDLATHHIRHAMTSLN